jgi:Fe2+ or Zn2+ uptake regulation protein
MNYSELNSFRKILETIAAKNGKYGWYSIVKTVDQLEDIEKIPTVFEVLQELTQIGYLRKEPHDGGNEAKYLITEDGIFFLSQTKG